MAKTANQTVTLDTERFLMYVGKQERHLTTKEFDLLKLLAEKDGRVISRESLMDAVWGTKGAKVDSRTVDQHIARLRHKLGVRGRVKGAYTLANDIIRTVPNRGYAVEGVKIV